VGDPLIELDTKELQLAVTETEAKALGATVASLAK